MKSGAHITPTKNGFSLSGVVDFDSVVRLRKQGEQCIASASSIEVDFSEVSEVDSSGLALMLAWLRCAKRENKIIHFRHVSASLCEVAAVCNVVQILGLSTTNG